MKTLATMIAAAALLASVQSQTTTPKAAALHKNIDAAAAKALLANKSKTVTVLDVRTPAEFKAGHLAGATLVDFKGADFDTEVKKLDKNKTYLLHCRSGARSTAAHKKLKAFGFKSIYHLDGGILAWEKAGGKIEK